MTVSTFIRDCRAAFKQQFEYQLELANKRRDELAKKRAAEQAQLEAEEYAKQLQRQKEYAVAQFDNDIVGRYEELSMLDTPGGRIAIIHKQYDYYISEWIYSLSEDGKLTRHRDQDGASVSFDSIDELLNDFGRYRYSGFNLYVPPHSSSSL